MGQVGIKVSASNFGLQLADPRERKLERLSRDSPVCKAMVELSFLLYKLRSGHGRAPLHFRVDCQSGSRLLIGES